MPSPSLMQNTHVFIVRIWCEPREVEGAEPKWRGEIEHVSSGKRRYIKDLDQISTFIIPYLTQMNVKLPLYWRLRGWLKQLANST